MYLFFLRKKTFFFFSVVFGVNFLLKILFKVIKVLLMANKIMTILIL